MKLSPIQCEKYDKLYRDLMENVKKAADLLIPDAYSMEKDDLYSAYKILVEKYNDYQNVLNSLVIGVIFNEAADFSQVTSNVNGMVISLLWSCQDIISEILLLSSDLDTFIANLDLSDPVVWKMDQLVETSKKFGSVCSELMEVSRIISQTIGKLDD